MERGLLIILENFYFEWYIKFGNRKIMRQILMKKYLKGVKFLQFKFEEKFKEKWSRYFNRLESL